MKAASICFLIAGLMIIPVLASAQISPNTRLLQKPEWDGAVVTGPWLEGEFRYQKFDKNKGFALGPTFALSFAELAQMEFGGRFWFMSFKPDKTDAIPDPKTGTGLSDIDIWTKYQFLDDPLLLCAGVLFTLPTGAEKVLHPRASGEFNFELFGSTRYYITDIFAVIGHLGFRVNADADKKSGDTKLKFDGKTQFELGGGIVYQPITELNILGELNFATEGYKDADNDIEITAGVDYALMENFSVRGGFGIGLDDMAPDFELIAGVVYAF